MSVERIARGDLCHLGVAGREPTFLVWGDSHADAWRPAMHAMAIEYGLAGLDASRPGCLPTLGFHFVRRPPRADVCGRYNEAIVRLVRRRHISNVVLAARWPEYLEGPTGPMDGGLTDALFLTDNLEQALSREVSRRVFGRGVLRMVRALRDAGAAVWVIGPVPEQRWPVPRVLARAANLASSVPLLTVPDSFYRSRIRWWIPVAQTLHAMEGVTVVDAGAFFCQGSRCRLGDRHGAWYNDDDHLSTAGALAARSVLAPLFDDLGSAHAASASSRATALQLSEGSTPRHP